VFVAHRHGTWRIPNTDTKCPAPYRPGPVVAKVFVTSVILPCVGQTARIALGIEWLTSERDHILKPEAKFIWPASTRFRL
jgi:hypothetical protein